MTKRTMPICCDTEQYKLIEKYAKKRGMINASQAVEKIKGLEILVTEEYNGIKNVNYVGLIPVLVKAIQEMEAKRKEDNKKFIDLNKRLLILENKLKNIESTDKEYIL